MTTSGARSSSRSKLAGVSSVRFQLVALVAAIVLPLAAASAWIAWQQYQAQREALAQTLLSVARALWLAADRELAIGRTLVETLAQSPLIDEKRFAEHHALAVKAVASRPGASVVLFSPSGEQVYNTVRPYGAPLPNVFKQAESLPEPADASLPRGGAQYVRRAFETRQPVYSDLFHGQVSGQYLVAVSIPVLRGDDMLYCLTIALPPESFQPLVSGKPWQSGSSAVLFDRRGFIIARAESPQQWVGKPVLPETLAAASASAEFFGRGINTRGEAAFRAIGVSPVSGWGAAVSVNEDAAFGRIWRSMRESAAAAALILVLGIGFALWMGRTLARRREAEAQSQAKDQFIAALSHELRNPIAAIALAADVLKRARHLDRQTREVVEIVSRQVTQLRRLLEDLLDSSRALYGKLALELRAVDLCACAAQVARDYVGRPAFHVQIDVAGAHQVWVKADPARLAQMVDNLIENAVKYGAHTVRIHVAAEAASGVLTVADDGQGISRELLPRLFEPFVQGEQTLERAQGGLGLGLALVKRLAALQGGTIEVRSEGQGKGSEFVLRLPLAGPSEARSARPASAPPKKRRVLIVEDSADARESLRQLLEADGHEVAVAGDGREALQALPGFRPQIALVDVGLPGMDGYELARRMRTAGAKGLVLVALTGYGAEADRRAAFAAGFDLHLTKPVPFKELQEALASSR